MESDQSKYDGNSHYSRNEEEKVQGGPMDGEAWQDENLGGDKAFIEYSLGNNEDTNDGV